MSFKDNFTRDEAKDEVQYDDSAFYTFGGTMLLCTILPLTWIILRRIFVSNTYKHKEYRNCECSLCEKKIENLYNKKKSNARNKTFYVMIFTVICLSYLSYNCYFEIQANSDSFKTFNPFEILEIPSESTTQQIKKAFKRLALKHHPDRNPNNLQAKAQFILLTKAYESLTDEVAKRNFELYGNPDGPESMRLAVGLPSFVLNKKNHMPILILFFILIVFILPAFVILWFNSTNNYDEAGVQITNHKIFYDLLNENILLRQMPFVLGSSVEYSHLKVKKEEKDELEALHKKYTNFMPKQKDNEKQIPVGNKKAICLLYSLADDQPLKTKSLIEDLNFILQLSPKLIYSMYEITKQFTYLKNSQNIQELNFGDQFENAKNIKTLGLNCLRIIMDYSQILIQKQAFDGSHLLQLPHFKPEIIKNNPTFSKLSKKLPSFLLFSEKFKREVLSQTFNETEINDIVKASDSIANYKIEISVFVDGFQEIVKDDYITVRLKIIRNGLENGKVIF